MAVQSIFRRMLFAFLGAMGCLLVMGLFMDYLLEEQTAPKEIELKKYPHLNIFLENTSSFRGISHNIDTGPYVFVVHTQSSYDRFFRKVVKNAIEHNWTLLSSTDTSLLFEKKFVIENASYIEQVQLTALKISGEIEVQMSRRHI